MPNHPGNQRGFTMIELMVALLLTAIALSGLIALFMTESKASGFTRHSTEASVLAVDKLEKLRTMSPAASGSDATPVNEQGQASGIFTRTWTVTPAGAYTDLMVVVSWQESGQPKSITMQARRL